MKRILLAILVLRACSPSFADDGAIAGVGGAVQLLAEHSTVRMVREKVDVQLSTGSARVRCEFVFENEGKAAAVKMGFPEEAWGDAAYAQKSAFRGFRSWVDGTPIRTTVVSASPSDRREYRAWHVKNVRFAAGQTRTVVNEYGSGLGGVSDGSSFFNYVLRTGASWKGKIGEAVIEVDVSRIPPYYTVTADPDGYQERGHKLIWVLKDFDPAEDISVSLMPRYPTLNGTPTWGGAWSPYSIVDGVALGSPRFLQEVGGSVGYERESRVCTISYGSQILKLTVGSPNAVLNGAQAITLPRAPVIDRYSRLTVPIGAVVKALGGSASYDSKNHQVHLHLKPKK